MSMTPSLDDFKTVYGDIPESEIPYVKDYLKCLSDWCDGRIDFKTYCRKNYLRAKKRFLPELMALREKGDYYGFMEFTLSHYEIMPEAFRYFDEIVCWTDEDVAAQFAIDAYSCHGDSVPAIRKIIRELRKTLDHTGSLPDEAIRYDSATGKRMVVDKLEVFRAGEEPIEKAKYRISWTTDKAVALFFFSEWKHRHANHIYRGWIRPEDVITYTDDRNEKEILQYGKVFDIEDITSQIN